MHRLRDNNPKEHFARALAELPCGARGPFVAHGLPDLKTLTELPPAQNRTVTKADSWDLQNRSKIQQRNRTTAVSIEESTLGSSFCFALEEKTDCPRVHEFLSALRGHHTAPSRGGIPASKTLATGELSPDKWIRTTYQELASNYQLVRKHSDRHQPRLHQLRPFRDRKRRAPQPESVSALSVEMHFGGHVCLL